MAGKRSKPEQNVAGQDGTRGKRAYVSQSDVPAHSLDEALRVAQSLSDNFGKSPTKPLRVAHAMSLSPVASGFRMLAGASIAYGLTEGGYNAEQISLTPLGRRIVAPLSEGDDLAARREALMRPRVIRDFLTRYNESKLPPENIGCNVLEELGVPIEKAAAVFKLIADSAQAVGFIRELKGARYVDIEAQAPPPESKPPTADHRHDGDHADDAQLPPDLRSEAAGAAASAAAALPAARRLTNRVFITHGKNVEIVAQLKELLTFGGFTPVVAIETETVSKPVPDKVMDDMRSCDAAVIHVGAEQRVMGPDGTEHRMLKQNVLIEIGAAMALYGRKFILLVEKGTTLPSNLQGLYEVRHEGGKLDYDATMRLLKAFNDFRS